MEQERKSIRLEPAWSSRAFNIGVLVGATAGSLCLWATVKMVLWYGADAALLCRIIVP
jgi:predicted MFS family arabinose efflux permease